MTVRNAMGWLKEARVTLLDAAAKSSHDVKPSSLARLIKALNAINDAELLCGGLWCIRCEGHGRVDKKAECIYCNGTGLDEGLELGDCV